MLVAGVLFYFVDLLVVFWVLYFVVAVCLRIGVFIADWCFVVEFAFMIVFVLYVGFEMPLGFAYWLVWLC